MAIFPCPSAARSAWRRAPAQLGYKSVKYITRLTVTDTLKTLRQGPGPPPRPEGGYAWYAGI